MDSWTQGHNLTRLHAQPNLAHFLVYGDKPSPAQAPNPTAWYGGYERHASCAGVEVVDNVGPFAEVGAPARQP